MSKNKQAGLGWLYAGLLRSSQHLEQGISRVISGRKPDEQSLDRLEEVLIEADLGTEVASRLRKAVADRKYLDEAELKAALIEEILAILQPCEANFAPESGQVIMFVGVNGSGKTTSIGKLASALSGQGRRVLIGACDTYRAAAVEQLRVWAERAGAHFVSGEAQADAAGLAFAAVSEARQRGDDVILIDTAGRLHNRAALMDELSKIIRAVRKSAADIEPETILVLDASCGQNALSQIEGFAHAASIDGLIITKLDGTARGGILVALAARYGLPVYFVGTGENIADLHPFKAREFATSLLGQPEPD